MFLPVSHVLRREKVNFEFLQNLRKHFGVNESILVTLRLTFLPAAVMSQKLVKQDALKRALKHQQAALALLLDADQSGRPEEVLRPDSPLMAPEAVTAKAGTFREVSVSADGPPEEGPCPRVSD